MNFYLNDRFFKQVKRKSVETSNEHSEWIRFYFGDGDAELCVQYNLVTEEIGAMTYITKNAKEDVKNQLSARQHIDLLNYLCELNPFELESRNQVAE